MTQAPVAPEASDLAPQPAAPSVSKAPNGQRRLQIVSPAFVAGFGAGAFAGVALALLAFALSAGSSPTPSPVAAVDTAVIEPTVVSGATPEARPRARFALDVRLGPGPAFAILGVLPRGESVDVIGRDHSGEWLAVRFPPGSQARGWIPASDVEGIEDTLTLAVVAPTPLPVSRSVPRPQAGTALDPANTGQSLVGNTPTPAPLPAIQTEPTPVPGALPDLVVTRIALLSDGRVLVVIGNRGDAPARGQSIFLQVRDLGTATEMLSTPRELPVGATLAFETTSFVVTQSRDVVAIVNPFGALREKDTDNNSLTVLLTPPPTPVPTPTFVP